MTGAIGTWHVLSHPIETIRCFGWQVFFKAVFPWSDKTFVSVLQESNVAAPTGSKLPELFRRCVQVEIQARCIYAAFARVFAEEEPAKRLFAELVEEEQEHAELVEVCRSIAIRGKWKTDQATRWQNLLPRLEQRLKAMEAGVRDVGALEEALQFVVQIEASELNDVFLGVVGATDSTFVHKLKPFYKVMASHIACTCDLIEKMAPNLKEDCDALRARFARV